MSLFTRIFGKSESVTKSANSQIAVGVKQMLGGALAGSWATDHREEVNHFTGMNYVAIKAIANQVAGSEVTAFSNDKQQTGVSRRKALRAKHGTLSRYKSIYGQDEQATTPLDPAHPLMEILQKPNPYESGSTFREKQAIQLRLTGTCLVWNVPGGGKAAKGTDFAPTVERYVLPTAMTSPVMPSAEMPRGGWRVSGYSSRYIPMDEQGFVEGSPTWTRVLGQVIDARQVQVIRLPHAWWFDDGQSPTSAGAQWIDTEQGVNTARVGQLRNGADPSLLWTLPPDVSPDQDEIDRATHKVNKKYAGPENSGKILIATNGTEVTPLSTSPKDMCYSEAFTDVRNSILALHQTPPVAVGLQEPGAYAAYYASMLAWRHSAIQPLCDMLAESDTNHLAIQFGDGLTVEIESPMIDDKDQDEKEFQNNVQARVCTLDELRAKRGLPPYEGPDGKQLWPPQAQSAAGKPTATNDDQKAGENDAMPFPSTPLSRQGNNQSKALRAAMRAAEDGDIEWLVSKMKSLGMSEGIGSDGGFIANRKELSPIGDKIEDAAPPCPKCGSDNTVYRRTKPNCVCGECRNQFDDDVEPQHTVKSLKRHSSVCKSRWVTIHPHGEDGHGVHIEIDDDGHITKGPKHLAENGITHIGDFGNPRSPKDEHVAEMIPHAHALLLEQHKEHEDRKARVRASTGVTPHLIRKHEGNGEHDFSTYPRFEEAARSAALENPDLGLDPSAHDTPEKVWDLIKEGIKRQPTKNSHEVKNLAEHWATESKKRPQKTVVYVHDSDWD